MTGLLIAVPALPMLAVPLSLAFGRRLPWRGGELVIGAAGLALAALLLLGGEHQKLQTIWFESGGFRLTVGLELDGLTWFAATVVAGISLLVAIYSLGYMADEQEQPRFFAELAFFIGAMLTLVLASSLILLFAAWEAVGVASYLLIGFRHDEAGARSAATKALLMTRLGDFGFLLGWLLVLLQLRTTDIATLLSAVSHGTISPGMPAAIALLLFVAAVGKSAQLPLTAWLPDAMVAPAPVSALIHSATMVAAGVYLLLRLYPLFAAAPGVLDAVLWVGIVTAGFSAVIALGEMDLKRVLAWSTSSNLGEMMLALGLGGPLAAMLHLTMHAIFKSGLFLAAGVVDKQTGTRDLRLLGGLGRVLPVTTLVFLFCALSLAGLQPFFFTSSDDVIVATALTSHSAIAYLMLGLIFLGGLYIARAGTIVFAGDRPAFGRGPVERSLPVLIGMGIPALAAVMGSLIIAVVPRMLPFGPASGAPLPWLIAVLLAGTGGLAIGGRQALRYRAAPALPWLPNALERMLAIGTVLPARAAFAIARSVVRIEGWLDAAARGAAGAVWGLARDTDRIEHREFGAGGDRLGEGLLSGGESLRRLESGKLYLYTLAVFVWSLAVVIAGGLMLGF